MNQVLELQYILPSREGTRDCVWFWCIDGSTFQSNEPGDCTSSQHMGGKEVVTCFDFVCIRLLL